MALPEATLTVYHDLGGQDGNLGVLPARTDIQVTIIPNHNWMQASTLSEKPISPTVKEGIKLVNTYKPRGLVSQRTLKREPGLRAAGKAIAEHKTGKVSFGIFKSSTMSQQTACGTKLHGELCRVPRRLSGRFI